MCKNISINEHYEDIFTKADLKNALYEFIARFCNNSVNDKLKDIFESLIQDFHKRTLSPPTSISYNGQVVSSRWKIGDIWYHRQDAIFQDRGAFAFRNPPRHDIQYFFARTKEEYFIPFYTVDDLVSLERRIYPLSPQAFYGALNTTNLDKNINIVVTIQDGVIGTVGFTTENQN